MGEVVTAVVTGFVSALMAFVAVAVFTGRQIGDLRGDIGDLRGEIAELRTEVRSDIHRLDGKFDQMMFELLRHVREGGHQPPPQAA